MTYDDVAEIKAALVKISELLESMNDLLESIEKDTTVLAAPLRDVFKRGMNLREDE